MPPNGRPRSNVAAILLSTFLVCTSHAKNDAVSEYESETTSAQLICQIKFQTARLKAEVGQPIDDASDYKRCIVSAKSSAKTALNKALKSLKKPSAIEALKQYHVARISALEGIEPGLNEISLDYDRRQQGLKTRADEAWTRFEVER